MPLEMRKARMNEPWERHRFYAYHHRNERVIWRMSMLPNDLDCQRNPLFYPPHPQHKALIDKLREFGLFRDEHLDFKDEMIRQKILRGKRIFGKDSKKDENE